MVALMKPDNRIVDSIIQGDCLEVLRTLDACSVDACVVDPPYGLGEVKDIAGLLQAWIRDEDDSRYLGKSGFMGKEWDAGVPGPRYWREVLRVMKPGAHILCFASTRTVDLMMIALRLAGFQCRDTLMWVYGSGFPKSTAIDKQIDKYFKAEREVIGPKIRLGDKKPYPHNPTPGNEWNERYGLKTWRDPETAPSTPEAQRYAGTGTALKPAHEPIILARKPLSESSIAANVLRWGTGGLNIDQCRVAGESWKRPTTQNMRSGNYNNPDCENLPIPKESHPQGRFPSNLLLSHSWLCTDELCDEQCPIRLLDEQTKGTRAEKPSANGLGGWRNQYVGGDTHAYYRGVSYHDQGGASRYFTQFSPTIPDVLYCSLCRLPYVVKHSIMNEKEGDIIPCLKSVKSAEKSSKHTHEHQDIVLGHAQEQQAQEQEGKSQRRSIPANNVVSNGWNTQATTGYSAQQSAWGLPIEEIAQLVRSAVNLCDSCVTAIAQSLVGLKHKTSPALPHGLASMPEINAHILHRNLVAYVDSLEKSGITPTTANLMRLFGSVEHAISQYTTPVSRLSINESDQITPYRYQSKASRTERNRGCEGLPEVERKPYEGGMHSLSDKRMNHEQNRLPASNHHPTVKPLALCKWLIRLICREGGVVLDPFCGSGSILISAIYEHCHYIGVEQEASYVEIARARVRHAWEVQP